MFLSISHGQARFVNGNGNKVDDIFEICKKTKNHGHLQHRPVRKFTKSSLIVDPLIIQTRNGGYRRFL